MRRVWIVFIVVTSLVSGGFLIKTACDLRAYFSLNTSSPAFSMEWKIQEKTPSSFALLASYQFNSSQKDGFQGSWEIAKPYFLNLPSAERALKELSQKPWDVFYNERDPAINSLQKNFPFKVCLQTLLTLGVFVYFLFFKKIMEKSTQEW